MIVVLVFSLFGVAWIRQEIQDFEDKSAEISRNFMDQQKISIKVRVDNAVEFIEFTRGRFRDRMRRLMVAKASGALQLVKGLYDTSDGQLTRGIIEQKLFSYLEDASVAWRDDEEFLFILDSENHVIANLSSENSKAMWLTGSNKQQLINLITDRKIHGEGFSSLHLENEGPGGFENFIVYSEVFEPLDWIIGIVRSREAEENIIQDEIKVSLQKSYFFDPSLIFCGDWNGKILFKTERVIDVFKSISGGITSGNLKEFIAVSKEGEGYVNHTFPDTGKTSINIPESFSYIKGVPVWGWYVGATVDILELKGLIQTKQDELDKRIRAAIVRIITYVLFFIVLASVFLIFLSIKIRDNLNHFKIFFEKAANNLTLIDIDKLYFRDTRLIASSANHMMRERLKVVNALVESEKRFFQIVEAVNIPMAIGKNNVSEYLNRSFTETFGYTIEDMPSMDKVWLLAYPDDSYRAWAQKEWEKAVEDTMDYTKPFRKQYCNVRCKNGRDKEVEIDFVMVGDRGLTTFRDLTDQRKREREKTLLEQKLLRAQKMEAIGLMAGGVAHDLNNILSGIVGYPDLILMSLPEDSDLRVHVEAIKRSGLRAADVVSDLLTIAKGVASTRKACSLNKIIEQYLESPEFTRLQSRMEDIELVKQYDDDILNISCSEVHIKKCIMNLVMNAVEAMDKKGEIIISTRNQYVDTPFSMGQYMEKGEYAVLSVRDNGHGIDKSDLERIFDPFYTKKVMGISGTGLGLSVVWNTVQDHGGGILVKSDESGTVFELFFPGARDEAEIRDEIQKKDISSIKGNGENVLIIDDEALQREIASGMLSALGYTTHTVSSGTEAVKYLRKESTDIILLDMIMPSGMNGLETYREILKIHPGQKAVIASGFSKNRDVETALGLGAGGFIKKPYTVEVLGTALKKELRKS